MERLDISSDTIRKLKITIVAIRPRLRNVTLCLPSLELLHLENDGPQQLVQFQGNSPFLRKAVVDLDSLCEEDCGGIAELLNYVSHVEELILHIMESEFVKDPFPILFEPGKKSLTFPNLKHLEATMCFRKHNFEAVLSMLYHSPVLQSVKLAHHEAPVSGISGGSLNSTRRKGWESKLPRNIDGDNRYVHFTDLQVKEHKKQFEEVLKKKDTPN